MSLHPAKHSKRPRLNANAHRRVHQDILPSHLRARRSRAHPPNAPNTAHSRRSVPCITCVFEWSIGLLVAQSSSLFAHPASQPPGAQTAPRRPTRPRKLHLRTVSVSGLYSCAGSKDGRHGGFHKHRWAVVCAPLEDARDAIESLRPRFENAVVLGSDTCYEVQ